MQTRYMNDKPEQKYTGIGWLMFIATRYPDESEITPRVHICNMSTDQKNDGRIYVHGKDGLIALRDAIDFALSEYGASK